jgi:hypothetical protein
VIYATTMSGALTPDIIYKPRKPKAPYLITSCLSKYQANTLREARKIASICVSAEIEDATGMAVPIKRN